jgi:hypothetical protein
MAPYNFDVVTVQGISRSRFASLRHERSQPERNKATASPFSAGENNKGETQWQV